MTVGLLPALGGGIREMAASGQAARLLHGYFKAYAQAFERLVYVSYLPETLGEFTDDPTLLARVRVLAPSRPMSRGMRAATMTWSHAAEFRACRVLRVFQVTGAIPAVLAQARFGIPYVTTYGFSYGLLSSPGPKRLLKAVVERVALRRAAAVITTTEVLRARAASLTRAVHLIPNGVDTAHFAPTDGRRPAGGPRRILYVGRLSQEKNLPTLVRAVAALDGRVPVRLVIVGAGPQEPALREQTHAAGIEAEFAGVVDQPSLPAVYTEADAFVLPSFTEGHPKVLLEAMASGVPCVASDCEGNRSLIAHGETGLLFDPRRADALASCLEDVLTDAALAARLTSAARAVVLARYDLRALVAREIALLQGLQG